MMRLRTIQGELLNARTTPTTWMLLGGSALMAAGSLLANLATFDTAELATDPAVEQAMHSSTVATMTFAFIAGLVSATSDLRFGRTDQLLLTDPRPGAVLATKTAVGAGIGLIYGTAGSIVAVSVLWLYYRINDVPIDLLSAAVTLPLLGVMLAAALFVAFGVGLGNVIRNQPAAIAGGLALLLVLQPPMLLGLPEFGRWLPGAAGLALTLAPDTALLDQWAGGLVLVGWTALALFAGLRRFQSVGA